MEKILKPYMKQFIADKDLEDDQRVILFINCYPVHIGAEFRAYVAQEFPNVFLLFVPANCEYLTCICT